MCIRYLVLTTALFLPLVAAAESPLPDNRHISVVGSAQLEAKPDIALVSFSVKSERSTSLAAKNDVDQRVNSFLDGLAAFEVSKDDVSASSLSTQAIYTYSKGSKREIDGYSAIRQLKVTLKDLTYLNDLLDFALRVKINSIGNINLKSSEEDTLIDEVNALAVENAKSKAQSYAKAFNAKLGNIYSISLTSNNNFGRFGRNDGIESIALSKAALNEPSTEGRYLQENIVFSASISAVFDLELD
ncbi:SIMPL domain-containing protein [Agaribacter flavus]|uniref:SIMPL domain-containing protein n=1 Tax=Agaribacter flavus TaxID=1902781 RepID=A0ABV7FND6_9ALTE